MARMPRSKWPAEGETPRSKRHVHASIGGGNRTGRSMKRRLPHRNGKAGVASLGGFGEASSWAWELGARPVLPGVEVVARSEGGWVNRGGPPVRRRPGRGDGSESAYKARAEVVGGAEGVGARHSTGDPQDSTTCGREGWALRSCWQRSHGRGHG